MKGKVVLTEEFTPFHTGLMAKKKAAPFDLSILLAIFITAVLTLILFFSFCKFSPIKHRLYHWQKDWKVYVNTFIGLTLEYPTNWHLVESHTLSNRVVDDPKEINTATFSGSEGKIVVEWGPMGFGGGCDIPNHKPMKISGKVFDICDDIQNDGTETWGGITIDKKDSNRIFGIRAVANPPLDKNRLLIEKILSQMLFF